MPPDPRAAARRDAGLRRVSRLTRWLLAGSLALTGLFAGLAARVFPGHGQQASAATTTTTVTGSQFDDSSSQEQDDSSQLQAPATTPSASGGSGSVTSGGS
jgi:ferric-dicitrate binding protein FerR (iron transport regulator)